MMLLSLSLSPQLDIFYFICTLFGTTGSSDSQQVSTHKRHVYSCIPHLHTTTDIPETCYCVREQTQNELSTGTSLPKSLPIDRPNLNHVKYQSRRAPSYGIVATNVLHPPLRSYRVVWSTLSAVHAL